MPRPPHHGHYPGSRDYSRILVALLAAGVATFAQLYSPQGILPLISRDFAVSPSSAGLMISVATLGVVVGLLPWSWAADRFGRVRTMTISLVTAGVFALLLPLSPSFEVLIGIRFVEGAALAGLPAIAIAYLHDEVSPRFTAIAAGTYISGTSIGGLLGRLLAVPVTELYGWRWGVASVAAVSIASAAVFILVIPPARGFLRTSGAGAALGLVTLLRNGGLLILFAQGFLLMGAFISVYNYLGFRLEAPPFLLAPVLSSLLFLAYLSGTVSSRLVGRLVLRRGRRAALLAALLLMLGGAALTLAPVLLVIVGGLVLLTAGFFAGHSVASEWVGRAATTGRAQASSLYNMAYYAGSSAFGWLSGLAFGALGWSGTIAVVLGLCVAAAALALLLPRGGDPADGPADLGPGADPADLSRRG